MNSPSASSQPNSPLPATTRCLGGGVGAWGFDDTPPPRRTEEGRPRGAVAVDAAARPRAEEPEAMTTATTDAIAETGGEKGFYLKQSAGFARYFVQLVKTGGRKVFQPKKRILIRAERRTLE